jgi:NAD+ diphosphatase
MDPKKIYKFCPICGNKLIEKPDNPECSSCGFIFFINPAAGCCLIIENDKKEILLTKRKHDPKKGYWDLPGGFMIPGENVETSSKREIKEELGVSIEMKKLVGFYPDVYIFQNVAYPILSIISIAKITGGKLHAADDISDYAFFRREQALQQELAFPSVRLALEDYMM